MATKNISVLMVCLGICRSPMAEAVLKHQITERTALRGKYDIMVDSAGTGAYHEGDDADERTIETCKKHGVPISCKARPVKNSDYEKFDYILAMDNNNLQTLLYKKPATSKAHISLFGAFDPSLHNTSPASSLRSPSFAQDTSKSKPKAQAIPDPYYGGSGGFESVFWQCQKFASGFLDYLENGEKWDEKVAVNGMSNGDGVKAEVRDAMGL